MALNDGMYRSSDSCLRDHEFSDGLPSIIGDNTDVKSGKISMQLDTNKLAASLRQVEFNHGLDVRSRIAVVKAVDAFSNSRYALGKALAQYKDDLGHGAWMDASAVIGKELG
jgi:hypothetical protein